MSNTYDTDILPWSEHQGALLKRLADGERVNDQVDWPNVIEEVESVGRSQLAAARSLLIQALVHDLKAEAWSLSRDVPTWRADARGFRQDAADNFSPSMRQAPRCRLALREGAKAASRDDRRPAAAAGARCVSGDARRAAERGMSGNPGKTNPSRHSGARGMKCGRR